MQGRIVAACHGKYDVFVDGATYKCQIRGGLRNRRKEIMPGDIVIVDEDYLVIDELLPRKNALIRPRIANIDQLVIVISFKEPEFSFPLLYRFLTYANINEIKAQVILTKTDLVKDDVTCDECVKSLLKIGIEPLIFSSVTKQGLEHVKQLFAERVSALMGITGVGKSSLINAIDPSYSRRVGLYSSALRQGKHKTTETVLVPFGENGFIADTPGFSVLDYAITRQELAQYFPGFSKLFIHCHFANCLHQNEKDCAVIKALDDGIIDEMTYNCYLKLLEEIDIHQRR